MTNWLGRRKFPRYPIVLPVRHEIAGSDRPQSGTGWTRDLSEAGGCLELLERFEPATVLGLSLRGDLGRISLEATVVWICQARDPGAILYGVSFRPLSARERGTLASSTLKKKGPGSPRPHKFSLEWDLPGYVSKPSPPETRSTYRIRLNCGRAPDRLLSRPVFGGWKHHRKEED